MPALHAMGNAAATEAGLYGRGGLVRRLLGVVLLFTMVTLGKDSGKAMPHPDYVPDEKTAERIAEAVLVAQSVKNALVLSCHCTLQA